MKTIVYIFCLLLAVAAVHADLITPTLQVSLLKYQPVPAQPGDTITAWIQVTNTGSLTANGAQLIIDPSYPFTPVSEADRTVNVGTLASGGAYVTTVMLAVDRNAAQGAFTLHVRATTGTGSFTTFDLPISVEGSTTSLAVTDVVATPSELVPGGPATLAITVKNIENTLIRDLTVNLDLSSGTFAPVAGTNQQKIQKLDAGEQATLTYTIVPQPTAVSSVYSIPVTLSFTTNDGIKVNQTETVGVVVHAQPELSVIVDQTSVFTDNLPGTVLLKLVNKGLSQIKFAEVTLKPGDGYELSTNTPTIYVGNIDSDDFQTAEFGIKPLNKTFDLQLLVTYKDALNNPYSVSMRLPITEEAKTTGGSSTWIIIVVLVVIVAAIVWWRRSRKKR